MFCLFPIQTLIDQMIGLFEDDDPSTACFDQEDESGGDYSEFRTGKYHPDTDCGAGDRTSRATAHS